MKRYIGTKLINAKPMTRAEYNIFRGWELPADENGDDEGYLVEYVDGGKANTAEYAGYVSWSPSEVFDQAYHCVEGLSFGMALDALLLGKRVTRSGWNGKGMWLKHVSDCEYEVSSFDEPEDRQPTDLLPWIGMKTAGDWFVPWVASQTDILAFDWQIVE